MSHIAHRVRRGRYAGVGAALLLAGAVAPGRAQSLPQPPHVNKANWELANKFSPENLRRVTYTAAVQPHFIGKTDSTWYNWKDHTGSTFYLIVPALKVKRPLFDHVKLAAALAAAHRKPYDATNLPFTNIAFTKRIVFPGCTLLSMSPVTSINRPLRFAAISGLVGT